LDSHFIATGDAFLTLPWGQLLLQGVLNASATAM
jgi:hypothetical protein